MKWLKALFPKQRNRAASSVGKQVFHVTGGVSLGYTVECVHFIGDTHELACGSLNEIYTFDVENGKEPKSTLQHKEGWVRWIASSKNANYLAAISGTEGGTEPVLRVWDLEAHKQLWEKNLLPSVGGEGWRSRRTARAWCMVHETAKNQM